MLTVLFHCVRFLSTAAQKTIYGHYTMYNKTVILRPEQVVLMHNVYCSGYVGGWGVSVWDPLDDYHSDQYSDSHLEHDCFITLGPMYHTTSGDQETSWRSLTGVVPDSLHAREDVHEMMKYPGCKAIANHWHWLTNAKDYGQGQNVEYKIAVDPTERKQNVLCFQAAQMKWNMHDGDFTKVVTDEGHWGQDIDKGIRNVLDGTSPMIKKAFYNGGRQTELY